MDYRGKVGENIVGGVECTPLIRFGFDCFNIAIMPGGACSLFFSNFIRLAIRKQKRFFTILLVFNWCGIVVHGIRSPHRCSCH